LGEEGVGAVILLQARHGGGRLLLHAPAFVAVILCAVVARGRADRRTADVDVEAEVPRVGAFRLSRAEVSLADVDGAVALRLQQAGQGDVAFLQAPPIPRGRAVRARVVLVRIDPVRGAVPGRVLAGQERDARRRADTHRVEVVETDPALG